MSSSLRANRQLQLSQWQTYGRSPVWLRMWALRCDPFVYDLPHPSNVHSNGRARGAPPLFRGRLLGVAFFPDFPLCIVSAPAPPTVGSSLSSLSPWSLSLLSLSLVLEFSLSSSSSWSNLS